jgi:hypothetical protein
MVHFVRLAEMVCVYNLYIPCKLEAFFAAVEQRDRDPCQLIRLGINGSQSEIYWVSAQIFDDPVKDFSWFWGKLNINHELKTNMYIHQLRALRAHIYMLTN